MNNKEITMARILALTLSLVLALIGPALAKEPEKIIFSIISTDSMTYLKEQFTPFLTDMEKKTGYKVEPYFAPDYAGVIEAMRFGKVDLGWFGNKSAMSAVDRANGEIFVKTTNPDGTEGYYSHLITHKDSGITSLDQVLKNPGKYTFGNGDPQSTSGFLIPSYYVFAVNKIDPVKHFKVVRNANHESNAMAVINKMVDVATNNSENLTVIKERFPEKIGNVRVIWTSPLIPSDPIVWRKDLSPEVKQKLRDFFLNYGVNGPDAARERQVLKTMINGWGPFKASSNDQLLPIRQLELFKAKIKLESDTAMAADEKTKKLGEINAQLDDIAQKMKSTK